MGTLLMLLTLGDPKNWKFATKFVGSSCSLVVAGLFEYDHMQYEADRDNDTHGEPSLAQMVKKSIDILKRNENGYILFAEGKQSRFRCKACDFFRREVQRKNPDNLCV